MWQTPDMFHALGNIFSKATALTVEVHPVLRARCGPNPTEPRVKAVPDARQGRGGEAA